MEPGVAMLTKHALRVDLFQSSPGPHGAGRRVLAGLPARQLPRFNPRPAHMEPGVMLAPHPFALLDRVSILARPTWSRASLYRLIKRLRAEVSILARPTWSRASCSPSPRARSRCGFNPRPAHMEPGVRFRATNGFFIEKKPNCANR